ncbi:S41 family peptidase [Roseisolibacter sp. H3M3-2]|uniref:S41 family peptidase n=1 Tax=Roseisolibacter sp. H3M3-2 TaxID=3031323 RepID=UPI0023DC491B|nr:S41 family peptidase [Roseisolibacter sp. H3M3-2]MDF1504172.1 S41 family peptidase [Roseisolibacter sp. H3M3-2]
MPSRRARAAALPLLLALGACDISVPEPTVVVPGLSTVAREYVDEVLRVMRTNALRHDAIDWAALRAQAVATAPVAQTLEETHPIITAALFGLGDGHSTYRASSGRLLAFNVRRCAAAAATPPADLPADVGYVRVVSFTGGLAPSIAYATALHAAIAAADRDALAGWVVDLRGNGGGNMWPMIAGIGPILGDDAVVGHFVGADGATSSWGYRGGASVFGSATQVPVERPYTLRRPRPRVAVLTDGAVASSGEAVAIAFRRRADTRSFGAATCGLSTANAPFLLSDGGVLNLTVSVMADRARTPYGDRVTPDEAVADPEDAVRRAVAWLRQPL